MNNVMILTIAMQNYKAVAKWCAECELREIELQKVCGYSLEQLKEMFLKGYTLTPPERVRMEDLSER